MHVDVIASVNEARSELFIHKTAIVIDALRATSTIVTALAHGCSEVIPVETVCQAQNVQQPGDWLGGERFCKKIAGFDAGNSPYEYMTEEMTDRKVIFTTTNGTRAIQKSLKAAYILAGAFINSTACARAALHLKKDIILLCSGTQDEFALEDGLCAGLLVDRLLQHSEHAGSIQINDLGLAMRSAYLHSADRLTQTLYDCAGGRRLTKLGFGKDVEYCAGVDTVPLVPILTDHQSMKPFLFE